MTRFVLAAAIAVSCACATAAQTVTRHPSNTQSRSKAVNGGNGSLKSFSSERALRETLAEVTRLRQQEREKQRRDALAECRTWAKADNIVGVDCTAPLVETLTVSGAAGPSIDDTNNQHDGVDEGGIVKIAGDILVVLRRGRLFTIHASAEQLTPIDIAELGDAAKNESSGDWYDELLLADRMAVVIGFSHERGGTEIVLFDLSPHGDLEHRATYQLRSNDYYSSQNYASRLIGSRLLLFSSIGVPDNAERLDWLPAMRRSRPGTPDAAFERITNPKRIFMPAAPLGRFATAHTLIDCDLAAVSFSCEASVVLGDDVWVSYTSPTAVYAWTGTWSNAGEPMPSLLYRMPFDGSPAAAIGVRGMPTDQLAFLESQDGHLNVVVAHPNDVVTLLRVPLESFADGSTAAPPSAYRSLATGLGQFLAVRFAGEYALVGGLAWDDRVTNARRVVATRWGGTSTVALTLSHDISRIDAMGHHAVVIGTNGSDLHMTAVRLDQEPRVAATLRRADAFQSEARSHAFLYRADAAHSGIFGLPVWTLPRGSLAPESSLVLFIRNQDLALTEVGALQASDGAPQDDYCLVSCTDWYGDARPIFSGDRIFALLGYELVEGRMRGERIGEVRRLDFTPRTGAAPQPAR